MSLKAFHIFFIALSVLLAVGFAMWEIVGFAQSGNAGRLLTGILSFAVGIGLIVYGVRFLRKLRHVGYL